MIKYEKVHDLIKREKLDALLVMSPYNRRYLSQFTGSSGAVIITENEKYLIYHLRYIYLGIEDVEVFDVALQLFRLFVFIIMLLKKNEVNTLVFEGVHVNYNSHILFDHNLDIEPLTNDL